MTALEVLVAARRRRRMTQAMVARRLNVSRVAITLWEQEARNITFKSLTMYARAVGYAIVAVPVRSEIYERAMELYSGGSDTRER